MVPVGIGVQIVVGCSLMDAAELGLGAEFAAVFGALVRCLVVGFDALGLIQVTDSGCAALLGE